MKIFTKLYNKNTKITKIFALTMYKKVINENLVKRKYLSGLFKTVTINNLKQYYLFGIKLFERFNIKQELIDIRKIVSSTKEQIFCGTDMNLEIFNCHSKNFPQFKNIHKGKTGVLLASGPSLLNYNTIENAIHIGVNTVYKKFQLDYWFAIDGQNITDYFDELSKTNFPKFFGQCSNPYPCHIYCSDDKATRYHIPNHIVENSKNAYKFYFDHPNLTVNRNIEVQALPDLGSCVFSALYFAIYLGLKKIYIVGCDCSANGYFDGANQKPEWESGEVTNKLLRGWTIFKQHVEVFHPDIELISINPVGLKGVFKDVYTQSYLDAHPEIYKELKNNIEIIKQ